MAKPQTKNKHDNRVKSKHLFTQIFLECFIDTKGYLTRSWLIRKIISEPRPEKERKKSTLKTVAKITDILNDYINNQKRLSLVLIMVFTNR